MSDKPFRNIRHDRGGRSLNLATQAQIPLEQRTIRNSINNPGELSSLLPTFKIFKTGNLHSRRSGSSGSFG
jgi:hypothetical protein